MGYAVATARVEGASKGKKGKGPPSLTVAAEALLTNRLYRIVCSYGWEQECRTEILAGRVGFHKEQEGTEKELRKAAVYPPGGLITGMDRCDDCRRWTPPGRYVRDRTATPRDDGSVLVEYGPWRPVCLDCYYAGLPMARVVHLPSSPGVARVSIAEAIQAGLTVRRSAAGEAEFTFLAWHKDVPDAGADITRRRRYLDSEGIVHEEFVNDDGFLSETLYQVAGTPAAAATEAA